MLRVRSYSAVSIAGFVGVLWSASNALPAQGKFVNYEDPQVKPIAVAAVGAYDYVLACNTPDNSVEIYLAEWSLAAPVARVRVGLSPVTVKWDASTGHFYTCNFLGDSVSRVRLDLVPATQTTAETVRAVLERTERVGDEPTDIAFDPNATTAVVTLHSSGKVRRIEKSDLSAVTGPLLLGTLAPVTVAPPFAPGPANPKIPFWFVKQARRIEILRDDRQYVINTMGGELSSIYDLGVFGIVPTPGGGTAFHAVSGVGSTNLGCAVNAQQDRMFVASQIAINVGEFGGAEVADEPTGFVQTWLKVLDLPSDGTAPVLAVPQLDGPAPKPLFRSIDLNRNYDGGSQVLLPEPERLAQVTDVVLVPDPTPGNPERIVLAAFGSERVAILTPDANDPSGYSRSIVNLGLIGNPGDEYSAVGPRGLAYSGRSSQPASGTTGLVFVMNRLDNSLAVVNPYNGMHTRRALAFDPTPHVIRKGRTFLYTARTTSEHGTVSCASCHVDARTDGLRWRLGEDVVGPTIAHRLIDGIDGTQLPQVGGIPAFPADKPETVTQTLQGLVTSHLEPDAMQFLATAAPYHWRGDKPAFQDFNEAFVNLQGMADDPEPGVNGLTTAQMNDYTSFINTIHFPPNPEQPLDRSYHGDEGLAQDPFDGSGALLGRKLFHTVPFIDGRSCVNCHSLPEGSSNTLTIFSEVTQAQSSTGSTATQDHPFESAALRNLAPREMVVPDGYLESGLTPFWPINGPSGLHHGGAGSVPQTNSWSINDNMHVTFEVLGAVVLGSFTAAQVEGLTEFVRQFDTGTAPAIGYAWTMTAGDPMPDGRFDVVLPQAAEANVGVAVYLRKNGLERGLWYDPTHQGGRFREMDGSGSYTAADLVNELAEPDDVLIVQATPTGTERRVADLTGLDPALTGNAPSNLELLEMVPSTAYVGITNFIDSIDPAGLNPQPKSMVAERTLANAVATAPVPNTFGVPVQPRHEPPRRFRIAGLGIRPGAKLAIEAAASPGALVWFDLAPTDRIHSGKPVWETAEELDALQTMAFLCGGHAAPGVLATLLGDATAASQLDPDTYNSFRIEVLNEDGTSGTSGFGKLEITHVR
ncbi:MAG: hypothetical protein NXI31_00655 [bacterium]|nr:hypothetical protein [bacterium]